MNKILIILLIFCTTVSSGQKHYFSPPVKIPILLSGNFAELRSNHFHSGIDIKTQGVSGIPVYAAADGYISRIAVSPTGYGNALYINHPNGTTTVYGHLQSFKKDIAEFVKESQYQQKSFRVNLQVPAGKFEVKKGEMIAKSGNSGSSGGPHLHFEIRNTETENPQNPLKYNFDIKDDRPPKVLSLLIAPLTDTSHINYETRKRRYPIVFYDGKYHIKNNPAIPVWGEIGFAIETNDYLNDSWSKCGIYSYQLTIDDELYFSNRLDEFSFAETRYINSLIDYETYIKLNRRFQKTWVEPGNKLSTYDFVKENGTFKVTGTGVHKIKIELKDTYGNSSVLEFKVAGKPKKILKPEPAFTKTFYYNSHNSYKTDDFQLEIPKGALYSNLKFTYSTIPVLSGNYSKIYKIHKNTVPLHTAVLVKIKTKNLPTELEQKALLVVIDDKTGKYWAANGTFENGWVTSEIKLFGTYTVKVDTVPPTIKPLSIQSKKTLTEATQIRFKVSDDLAGIKTIEGFLDGKWALFEYDAKRKLITHKFDKKRFDFNQEHLLQLTVTDYRNNQSKYEATFWK
jgi:hypothetical protein